MALLKQWVTDTPVPGEAASRGRSAWHLVSWSRVDLEPAQRGNPFFRSEADEQSTPPSRGPAARPRPKIWALMGLQDAPLKRLLDNRLGTWKCQPQGLGWRTAEGGGAAHFLLPVDKHLFECLKSWAVQSSTAALGLHPARKAEHEALGWGCVSTTLSTSRIFVPQKCAKGFTSPCSHPSDWLSVQRAGGSSPTPLSVHL